MSLIIKRYIFIFILYINNIIYKKFNLINDYWGCINNYDILIEIISFLIYVIDIMWKLHLNFLSLIVVKEIMLISKMRSKVWCLTYLWKIIFYIIKFKWNNKLFK